MARNKEPGTAIIPAGYDKRVMEELMQKAAIMAKVSKAKPKKDVYLPQEYLDALKNFQDLLDRIGKMEEELAGLGERKGNAPQEVYEDLKARIREAYARLDKLAQRITETAPKEETVEKTDTTEKTEEVEDLEKALEELKKLRARFDKAESKADKQSAIEEIYKKFEGVQDDVKESKEASEALKQELEAVQEEITRIQKELRDFVKEYQDIYDLMDELVKKQPAKLDSDGTLTAEELDKLRAEYSKEKDDLVKKAEEIKETIKAQRGKLSNLRSRSNKLEKDIQMAEALGLTVEEYKEITRTLDRRKLFEEIIAKEFSDLEEIVAKPAKERSAEEKQRLKVAKDEIIKKVAEFKADDRESKITDIIEVLFDVDLSRVKREEPPRVLLIDTERLENIRTNVEKLRQQALVNREIAEEMLNQAVRLEDVGDEQFEDVFNGALARENRAVELEAQARALEEEAKQLKLEKVAVNPRGKKPSDRKVAPAPEDMKEVMQSSTSENSIQIEDSAKQDTSTTTTGDSLPVGTDGAEYSEEQREAARRTVAALRRGIIEKAEAQRAEARRMIEEADRLEAEARAGLEASAKQGLASQDGQPAEEVQPVQTGAGQEDNKPEEIAAEEEYQPVFGRVYVEPITLRGLSEEETRRRYEEAAYEDLRSRGIDVDPDEIGINLIEAEVDEAASDIQYQAYSTYRKEKKKDDEEEVVEEIEEKDDKGTDIIPIYVNSEDSTKYLENRNLRRFGIEPTGNGYDIMGMRGIYYPISEEDAQRIREGADNPEDPYVVEERPVHLEQIEERPGLETVVTIYVDKDNDDEKYIRKPELDRFFSAEKKKEILDSQEGVRIPDAHGVFYRITEEDVEYITHLQEAYKQETGEDYHSPYTVEFKEAHLGKRKGPNPPVEDETEIIQLYRDTNDNGQVYADAAICDKFSIDHDDNGVEIDGKMCYKISKSDDRLINVLAGQSKSPKMEVRYKDIHLEKHIKPTVEGIIRDLTADLDIHRKDVKRYNAANLKVAKRFSDELHSGNYVYNVVHVAKAVVRVPFGLAQKISGKLLLSARGKRVVEEMIKRTEEWTEEELEVMFEEYKGSRLKTDMNKQINDVILARLRKYGMSKVEDLNNKIKGNYARLFALLGQVEAFDKSLESGELTEEEAAVIREQRAELMKTASGYIQSIREDRVKADNLLSGGVHGMEEDFKAVRTKLSYVGMRFAKEHDFDNELQTKLGDIEDALAAALARGDAEAVVDRFMALETTYIDNTRIGKSLVGSKSKGKKYYSPLAEQFDYRDDPFISDLFTTIALTTAAISAINALHVRAEQQRLVAEHNQQVANANQHNAAMEQQVHQTGQDIAGKRGAYAEGMRAQTHEGIHSNTNQDERYALDTSLEDQGMYSWSFSDRYHQIDHANHEAARQLYDDTTAQLSSVTQRVQSGAITETQALEELARISSSTHKVYVDEINSILETTRAYAAANPQHDLTAVIGTMEYLQAHPDAIANMNQAMVDSVHLGESLAGLSTQQVAALGALPDDVLTALLGAGGSALLAANVANAMKAGARKGKYGNEVTTMWEQYREGGVEPEEENEDEMEEMFEEEENEDERTTSRSR